MQCSREEKVRHSSSTAGCFHHPSAVMPCRGGCKQQVQGIGIGESIAFKFPEPGVVKVTEWQMMASGTAVGEQTESGRRAVFVFLSSFHLYFHRTLRIYYEIWKKKKKSFQIYVFPEGSFNTTIVLQYKTCNQLFGFCLNLGVLDFNYQSNVTLHLHSCNHQC